MRSLQSVAGPGECPFLAFLSPFIAKYLFFYIEVPGIRGDGSLMLWLLVMDVNVQRWNE
jgi:hypothetical protein